MGRDRWEKEGEIVEWTNKLIALQQPTGTFAHIFIMDDCIKTYIFTKEGHEEWVVKEITLET